MERPTESFFVAAPGEANDVKRSIDFTIATTIEKPTMAIAERLCKKPMFAVD